ncbi:CBO0543 family protein [Metabacillus halosaccharovorans]|uniref:CBO0543 family protein n=1 Tax=Metabacillus halosaccharovorans TaxID=930124 RepID=UPI00203A3A4A|nr:CBO0543 family protein [Metabacillus halosaccharovorans]MCM3443833.1 hypothetical protein [Metabacillus halosaccharovorans]
MDARFENMDKIRLLEDHIYRLDVRGWLENEFLSWEWWILLFFLVVPWFIWLKLAKRDLLVESYLFGSIIIIITILLDTVGLQFSFWEYPIEFLPVIPRAFPFDVSMVPIAFMLLFNYFRTWKSYSIALLIMALIYAFIGEPFCEWIHLVYYIKWNYLYSFLYYIVVGIGVRALVLTIVSLTKK